MYILLEWISNFVPGPGEAILGSVMGFGVFLLGGGVAAKYRTRGGRVGDTRKIFHFVVFTAAAVLRFFFSLGTVCAFGGVVFLAILVVLTRGPEDPVYEALARPGDAPYRSLHVLVPLLATALGGLTVQAFSRTSESISYLVTGWGDAVAEPVGIRWGRHRYWVPSLRGMSVERSLEGSGAIFAASYLATLALLVSNHPLLPALAVSCAVALTATAVEAISPHGLDNYTVMVAVAAVCSLALA